jgi:hypothetical protein
MSRSIQLPNRRRSLKIESPIYTRIKRISLYERHAALKPFFVELETLPNDIANEALLRAISLGAETALREAQQKISQRRRGLPERDTDLQPVLLEVLPEIPCES